MGTTQGGFTTLAGEEYPTLKNAGAPTNGVDEVQTLTGGTGISAGTFTLLFKNPHTGVSQTTAPIAFDATAAQVLAALRALSNFPDTGGATASGGPINTATPVQITFANEFSGMNLDQLVVDDALLTGGTVEEATTTAGVKGTHRGAAKGALLADTTTPKLHQNSGTAEKPTWSAVGAQTS